MSVTDCRSTSELPRGYCERVMKPPVADFADFYLQTRHALYAQTFAITGDLAASSAAVRDAYVAAHHHWPTLQTHAAPITWVRERAWRGAQLRHATRLRSKASEISQAHIQLIAALQQLDSAQRRAIVLAVMGAALPIQIADELGVTPAEAQRLVDAATVALGASYPADELAGRLRSLEAAVNPRELPRCAVIERRSRRQRRVITLTTVVGVGVATLLAGLFVLSPQAVVGAPDSAVLSRSMLLKAADLAPFASANPDKAWQRISTSDNTEGTGINTMCQKTRFADENGADTLVRVFATPGPRQRRFVQTVEVSSDHVSARRSYLTMLQWYASCSAVPVQLLDAYTVTGVADEAYILVMRLPGATTTSYSVTVARTGSLVAGGVLSLPRDVEPNRDAVMTVLRDSITLLCQSPAAGACIDTPQVKRAAPPASGEAPGMLTAVDLPGFVSVTNPWVGTEPATATSPNAAATTCDRTTFPGSRRGRAQSRTYVIPRAKLPAKFGLSQTIGKFASSKNARDFTNALSLRMQQCPEKDLGSTVSRHREGKKYGATYSIWRLTNQINDKEDKVSYWTGWVRVGDHASQITFTPAGKHDIDRPTFERLLIRAGVRLQEVANR